MQGEAFPRWLGVLLLMAIATTFGANHIFARVAFDHGTSVSTAVAVRSAGTALFVLVLLRIQGVSLKLAAATRWRAAGIGALIALQSWLIYSAVARIPVALALLAFNTYPLLFVLISSAMGTERLSARTLVTMPVALIGLALALDVAGNSGDMAGRWAEIGAGVSFALGAAVTFATVLFLNTRWLKDVDGRVRTLLTMSAAAVCSRRAPPREFRRRERLAGAALPAFWRGHGAVHGAAAHAAAIRWRNFRRRGAVLAYHSRPSVAPRFRRFHGGGATARCGKKAYLTRLCHAYGEPPECEGVGLTDVPSTNSERRRMRRRAATSVPRSLT